MPNHLLSITAYPEYHAAIIRAFRHANRLLKNDRSNSDRTVCVYTFVDNGLPALEATFDSLVKRKRNRIVILTSGLLNHDLSAKTKPKSVLEIATDEHPSASTLVIGSSEMPMHGRPFTRCSRIYTVMALAIFHRRELGKKFFISGDTAIDTIANLVQEQFFPDVTPMKRKRYLPASAPLPFP